MVTFDDEIKKYLNYHSYQKIDNCLIFFDLFLGNMISVFTIDDELPLKLLYNSSDIYKYNNKLKFNFSEKLELRAIEGFVYIAHINCFSKIEHYYKNNSIYVNEKNNNKIIYEKDNYFYLDDHNGNIKVFKKVLDNAYLIKNNNITIELNNNNLITKIIDNDNIYTIKYKNNKLFNICKNNKELLTFKDEYYIIDNIRYCLNKNNLISRIIYKDEIYDYKYFLDNPYSVKKIVGNDKIVSFSYNLKKSILFINNKRYELLFDQFGKITECDIIEI